MAILVLSLLVCFSISISQSDFTINAHASEYDLPIGDHNGVPMHKSQGTVRSDYNPNRTIIKNSLAASHITQGYYYEKLNTPEKKDLYNAIFIASDSQLRLKKGAKLPDGTSEADVVSKGGYLFYTGSSSRNRYYNATSQECATVVNEAIEAVCYDHMENVEYYMCDWYIYEFLSGGVYKDYILMREYTDDDYTQLDREIKAKAAEYAGKVRALGLVKTGNIAATVLNVHDWYTQQVEYGHVGSTGSSYFNLSHTAYGALCKGRAVCDGYSLGYALILKELGIASRVVTGLAKLSSGTSGGHAWNMVKINGQWYEEDTTWADSKITNISEKINHAYYNRTTSEYLSGIEGNIHERVVPYGGRLIDTAKGTKYTYQVSLSLLEAESDGGESDPDVDSETKVEDIKTDNSNGQMVIPPQITIVNSDANTKAEEDAQTVTCSLNVDQTVSINGVKDSSDSTVVIPDLVLIDGKKYPVTRIAAGAFKGNNDIKEIKGGVNLRSIGNGAFSNCRKLKSIDLSGSDVKEIGKKAFSGCDKLKVVKLNGDYIKKIGSKAFNKVSKNIKITIYAKNKKVYGRIVTKATKAGAKTARFKHKKSLGIKYN